MRYALVNPDWSFEGSIYFGCREPHLPLEFGYAKALLEREGHEVAIFDGQLGAMPLGTIRDRVAHFRPDVTVVTTAPSYLFWRCAPPELRVPRETVRALRPTAGVMVAVGPHGSTTPRAVLQKLGADLVIMGECEEILPRLGGDWRDLPSVCHGTAIQRGPHASDMTALPALRWPLETVERHLHHHHRFDSPPFGPGAEIEASRGCPYHCTFCAKDNFRDRYRRRPLDVILEELDSLLAQGVQYVYFIDEIFLPNRELLEALAERPVRCGIQTRIDLWSRDQIDLLADAGCVSIEAGLESISEEGRDLLNKSCKLSTAGLAARLIHARRRIPFVQANLIEMQVDSPSEIEEWRRRLNAHGVWANKPVPLFPYPGSPEYTRRWGAPDDQAWERAHADYLARYADFSDVQERLPLPLADLELVEGRL